MSWTQVLTPNPTVACTPGWCLKYVSDAFGVSNIPHTNYQSATDAWNASKQHQDQAFPDGLWVPVWFSLANVPEGHVALRAPDGSIWSSSDPNTNVPHHHPSLNALVAYYANANPLTYLGWSEDIGGTPVITQQGEDIMDENDVKEMYRTALHREPESDAVVQGNVGLKAGVALANIRASQEWLHQNHEVAYFDQTYADLNTAHGTIDSLQKQLTEAQSTIDSQAAQFKGLQDKSVGLAKNLDDSQLELKDAKDQLAQAESIASDDDAKIKDLTAKLSAAQAQIEQLKAGAADKPPANLTNTSTPTPQKDSAQNPNLLSNLLGALVSFIRGGK